MSFNRMYLIPKGAYDAFIAGGDQSNVNYTRQFNNVDVNDGGKLIIRNDDNVKVQKDYQKKPTQTPNNDHGDTTTRQQNNTTISSEGSGNGGDGPPTVGDGPYSFNNNNDNTNITNLSDRNEQLNNNNNNNEQTFNNVLGYFRNLPQSSPIFPNEVGRDSIDRTLNETPIQMRDDEAQTMMSLNMGTQTNPIANREVSTQAPVSQNQGTQTSPIEKREGFTQAPVSQSQGTQTSPIQILESGTQPPASQNNSVQTVPIQMLDGGTQTEVRNFGTQADSPIVPMPIVPVTLDQSEPMIVDDYNNRIVDVTDWMNNNNNDINVDDVFDQPRNVARPRNNLKVMGRHRPRNTPYKSSIPDKKALEERVIGTVMQALRNIPLPERKPLAVAVDLPDASIHNIVRKSKGKKKKNVTSIQEEANEKRGPRISDRLKSQNRMKRPREKELTVTLNKPKEPPKKKIIVEDFALW